MSETETNQEPKKKRPKQIQNEKEGDKSPQRTMEHLLQEIEKLQKMLSSILAEAQENATHSTENFVADQVRKMGAAIGHYFATFQALNVMSRKEMEEEIRKMYNHQSIREAEEELHAAEDEWNSFLEEIDAKIDPSPVVTSGAELFIGSKGPLELKLTDVSTGRYVTVQDLITSTSTVLILLRHFA